jgi:hypothetical protein
LQISRGGLSEAFLVRKYFWIRGQLWKLSGLFVRRLVVHILLVFLALLFDHSLSQGSLAGLIILVHVIRRVGSLEVSAHGCFDLASSIFGHSGRVHSLAEFFRFADKDSDYDDEDEEYGDTDVYKPGPCVRYKFTQYLIALADLNGDLQLDIDVDRRIAVCSGRVRKGRIVDNKRKG